MAKRTLLSQERRHFAVERLAAGARPEGIQGIFLGVMDGIIHALSIITGL